jgi:hypothetical protein
MPPALVPGGRIFETEISNGFLGWPAGSIVFGRVRGPGISIWTGTSAVGMRCLPPSPCYNGCCCPADSFLLAILTLSPTWVIGSTLAGTCFPCAVCSGTCECDNCDCTPCTNAESLCAVCSSLCGGTTPNAGGTPGNLEPFPLTSGTGFYEMEALGFSVSGGSLSSYLEGTWSGTTIPPFTGPDGVIFPGNTGAGSSGLQDFGGGHLWMGKYAAGDGSILYVMVVGGAYPVGAVPGWTSAMTATYPDGLTQVYTLAVVPAPASPKLAFGHAANCNAYQPITWGNGSFSAPGNGLLIGDPTQGVIPS